MNARGAMLTVLAAASLVAGCAPETGFDLVIEGGRVMAPESGLDGVRNVGTARWPVPEVRGSPPNPCLTSLAV